MHAHLNYTHDTTAPAATANDTATTNHSAINTTDATATTSTTINKISRISLRFCAVLSPILHPSFFLYIRREKGGRTVAHEAVGAVRVRARPSERDEDDIRSDPKAGTMPPPVGKRGDAGINLMYEVIAKREEGSTNHL